MKYNFLIKFGILITMKLTTAGRACNKTEPMELTHTKVRGDAKKCDTEYNCLLGSSYQHHSYYACTVCTTPSCENGKINCGSGSSTKELHWSLDVFEAGFYTYSLSKSGFIKIVLNIKLYNKIELFYERESRKITITLKECKFTNEEKEDCIENRSEAQEDLDPSYSCIFVAIGYLNATTINFVTIHTCSRVASSYIGVKNVYSLKRPIENFVKRFMKKITIQFDYDKENIFDGVPIILACDNGGFFFFNGSILPCPYVFPEFSNNQGLGYYIRFYQDGYENLRSSKNLARVPLYPFYFNEKGMIYSDSKMELIKDNNLPAHRPRKGCYDQSNLETTSNKTKETKKITKAPKLNISTLTTTTTVETQQPDLVIPTGITLQSNPLGDFTPPLKNNLQVTLPPLPVITIGNATLIRNNSGLPKLNLTAFMKIAGPDSLHPSYLLDEMNPNKFLIPLRNNALVDIGEYQLSSPEKVKKKKKSSSQAGATDSFSSGTKSLVIILNKCNLLLLFLKFL